MAFEKINNQGSENKESPMATEVIKAISEGQEQISKNLQNLLRYRERVGELFPNKDEIEMLSNIEQGKVLNFLGRLTASMYWHGSYIRDKKWSSQVIDEAQKIFADKPSPQVVEILERIAKIAGIYIAAEINSNTMGDTEKTQLGFNNSLAGKFFNEGKEDEAKILLNPLNLERGTIYYVLSKDKKTLEEQKIENVYISDKQEPRALINGKEVPLIELNGFFASGLYMLRDGSNFFGNLSKFEFPQFQNGETVKISYFLPTKGEVIKDLVYVGDNRRELEKKWGLAYLPYIKNLLVVKFLVNGEMREVSYSNFEVVLNGR